MTSARTAPRRSRSTARPARRVVRRPVRRAPARRRPAGSTAARPVRRRGRRLRDVQLGWWAVVLVVLAVVTGVAWQADAIPTPTPPARCAVAGGSFTLSPEQAANARTIAAVAAARHLPERAVVIAVATALQETHLRNLPYGDRDSLGLFQQRPSQGWGTPAQVQDPSYAAGKFFDHLVTVPNWESGRLTDVSQAVQRSGAPGAYAKWEATAQAVADSLTGPVGLACS
jgi:hypothetical protein